MKKVISLLICILLLVSVAVPAFAATDVDAIKPSGTTIVVGITGKDVPVHGTLPNANAGTAIIVLAPDTNAELYIDEQGVQQHYFIEVDEEADTTVNKPEEENDVEIPEDATMGEAIFLLTNEERLKEELPTLSYNYDLQDAADLRAKECAELFSHTRPDGSSCHTVVKDFDYKVTGENLIKADKPIATAESLVEAWMNSQGHKENILMKEYTSIAIGVYETESMVYAVQIFMG